VILDDVEKEEERRIFLQALERDIWRFETPNNVRDSRIAEL